ncbi:hypothetical protein AB0Q95_27365 [Streptomyces sp. NPDC059900]|uniref:hypothetical protein n=1 Tax=Streptomyces sp. NPDC059900 TaxID=3155816 RepID=UPI00343EDF57
MTDFPPLRGESDPTNASTTAEFAAKMQEARHWAGNPSLETIARISEGYIPKSTAHDILKGKRLPKLDQLHHLLVAFKIPRSEWEPWQSTWMRLSTSQSRNEEPPSGNLDETRPFELPPLHLEDAETPIPWPTPVDHVDIHRKIVLWGPPASGKTCFLAALNAAIAYAPRNWTLVGGDENSAYFLDEATIDLVGHCRFPPATMIGRPIRFHLTSPVHISYPWHGRRKVRKIPLRIQLSIFDPPGGSFDSRHSRQQQVIDLLAQADGIIYFFDAVREAQCEDAWDYFHSTLSGLERKIETEQGFMGGRLPHRLAVCVSKADTAEVFDRAIEYGLVARSPSGSSDLRVLNPDALFRKIASDTSASFVDFSIRRFFHASRVRYFATSSVGFPLQEQGSDRRRKVIWHDDGPEIVGGVYPVNVLEPILWMN